MIRNIDWRDIFERYPIGSKVRGKVTKVWQVGALIEFGYGLEGLVRNGEIVWGKIVQDTREFLKEGQEVDAQILRIEAWRERISLSVKRTQYDPWSEHADKYTKGRTVRAKIIGFAREDILLQFENYVEGVLPRDEIVPWSATAESIFELGDWVEANVKEQNEKNREIIVSMKDRLEEIEQDIQRVFAAKQESYKEAEDSLALPPDEIGGVNEEMETDTKGLKIDEETILGPSRILVVENMEEERFQLRSHLAGFGVR